ncbi:selenocysteine-specific translation elongation factor [Peribacillus alkalitolerans]|uniref:selenocysteine-specific translation elongation factor n=1 Tax=Peribacillus alkalitolerans TaxID=1550385 RepID=UPI0013D83E37|nr:selenocysteine-specific translation elongation factor [Peribacillus alkalitolerans]
MKKHFTIGMAGHIDHGKTTLTKALTNVDTDRLKEEKVRKISIELGFAPLIVNDEMQISLIDVPGHERFIRQMIAGVAGIDLVILVVAADEGVMPQTKEHLEILNFLGIKGGIVAITKIDRVDVDFLELVKDEICLELEGSIFSDSPIVMVNSLSQNGIDELKQKIVKLLEQMPPRETSGVFRLPIDQVFTIKGQGTIVRGTVYEGVLSNGEELTVLPKNFETRARQIQVHNKPSQKAFAGQRAAINLSGLSKSDVKRGDVIVSSNQFVVTRTIDVAVSWVNELDYIVKQRMPIKCHIGTSEVMGRIVFFDRNEIRNEKKDVVCQLRLEEEIVTKRGDRFILRRPSPSETIGGGWVIDPSGQKYRFGYQTIEELVKKKCGTPIERASNALIKNKALSLKDWAMHTSLSEEELIVLKEIGQFVEYSNNHFSHVKVIHEITENIHDRLIDFQHNYPMKEGINKAELIQEFSIHYPAGIIQFVLDHEEQMKNWKRNGQYFATNDFSPHVPLNWEKRVNGMLEQIRVDAFEVKALHNYLDDAGIPENLRKELIYFLIEHNTLIELDEKFFWKYETFEKAVSMLKKEKVQSGFTVGEAKDILGLSRKYMIPFLEKLDHMKLTKREDNTRFWIN